MKNFFSLLFTASILVFLAGCGGDDGATPTDFSVPTASTPIISNQAFGATGVSISFTVSVDEDLSASWTATSTGGIALDATSGDVVGTAVDITFDAISAGAASITLTVTDTEGQMANTTVVFEVKEEDNTITVSSNITSDVTWETGKTYVLTGRIAVVSGTTLTIQEGTLIKGQAGSGSNATALLIARGARLNALGTATAPIIFTSVADEIKPGEIQSPNLDPDLNGLWGGLIILGNARISADNVSEQIEGIPASDVNGLYGGTDDEDNSGTIRYISVRHGGANIGEGNEINGITLGGVGSGTIIEYVEVVGNQDDGIEWFGGTVNVSNVLVWNAGDDAIDTDQAWAGTLDNFIIVNPGDEGFELDGPEGSYTGAGHTIKNGTMIAGGASGLIDFDDNSDVNISNIYFTGLTIGQDIEGYAGFAANSSGFSASSFQVILPTVDADGNAATYATSDFFRDGSSTVTTEVTTGTVGADMSVFAFTFAKASGALDNL